MPLLQPIAGRAYYLPGSNNLGVVATGRGGAIAIDTGLDKDTGRLLRWATEGIGKYPDNASLLDQATTAYRLSGNLDSAMAVGTRLMQVDTGASSTLLALSKDLVEGGRPGEAMPYIDYVAQHGDDSDKQNASAILTQGGLALLQQQPMDAANAYVALKRAVEVAPAGSQVLPTANPDQLALFRRRDLDAVWTVEPWVSRLETEAGGKVLVEEKDAVTTVLVASVRMLNARRELVRRVAAAHRELSGWIEANPEEAQRMVRAELRAVFRAEVSPALIERAWGRMTVTADIAPAAFQEWLVNAQRAGFLRTLPDLSRLVEVVLK